MKIDYTVHAVLYGIRPSTEKFMRGGKLGEGTLGKMVSLGVEHIEKGYYGIMVLFDGHTYDGKTIQEIAKQPDFPA